MKKALSFMRLAAYLLIIIYVFVLSGAADVGGACLLRRFTGLLCPTCGATRACVAFLHLNFREAFAYHPVFTLSLYPVSLILAAEDIFVIIKRELFKKESSSLVERVFI